MGSADTGCWSGSRIDCGNGGLDLCIFRCFHMRMDIPDSTCTYLRNLENGLLGCLSRATFGISWDDNGKAVNLKCGGMANFPKAVKQNGKSNREF